MRCVVSAIIVVALMACGGDKKKKSPSGETKTTKGSSPDKSDPGAFDPYDISSCRTCHGAVVGEYLSSMHGRSNERYDPIYKAVLEYRQEREGVEIDTTCDPCHNPRKQENRARDVFSIGCATCHATKRVLADRRGDAALVPSDQDLLFGPHELPPDVAPGHGTGPVPEHMKDGTSLCQACHRQGHDADKSGSCGVGTTTYASPADGRESTDTCVSCHMPQVRGPSGMSKPYQQTHSSHTAMGPHDLWYREHTNSLSKAVDVHVAWSGDTLDVTLANKTGHTFPSGFHGRVATFEIIGFGEDGKPVWHAEVENPRPGLPGEVLQLRHVDADGNATLPPYAAGPPKDTRLGPYEIRRFSFKPPREVVHARAMVWYRLLSPELGKLLGMYAEAPELKEKFVTRMDALR